MRRRAAEQSHHFRVLATDFRERFQCLLLAGMRRFGDHLLQKRHGTPIAKPSQSSDRRCDNRQLIASQSIGERGETVGAEKLHQRVGGSGTEPNAVFQPLSNPGARPYGLRAKLRPVEVFDCMQGAHQFGYGAASSAPFEFF